MRFKRIYIEITNCCNLSCSFCSPVTRPARFMSVEEFQHIITEVKPFTKYVYFHVKGEPLLHPNLEDFLQICKRENIAVNLTTNGTLLSAKREVLLSDSSLRQVNISLHSASGNGSTEAKEYLENAVQIAKELQECHGVYAVFRIWNLNKSRQADDISLSLMTALEQHFPGIQNLAGQMMEKRSVALTKGVFISWEKEFQWPSLLNPFVSDTGICYGTRHMVAILADGTVVPCCLDSNGEAPLGNVFKQSFSKIVQSDVMKKVCSDFEKHKLSLSVCRHCSFRKRFD